MYIITNTGNKIIGVFEENQLQKDEQFYFYQDETTTIRFLKETHNLYAIATIEETILQDIYNYAYTEETGFIHVEPVPEPEPEKTYTLDEAAEVLAQEVSQNGYDT